MLDVLDSRIAFRARSARSQAATPVVDALILMDNSRDRDAAFTVCRDQIGEREVYDLRAGGDSAPPEIAALLDIVSPRGGGDLPAGATS